MRERRATKRALLTSIMALVMCVVMLVGTTFAWFTDTATANVNKIEAGKLKLGLEMATAWDADGNPTDWADAKGKTLNFLVDGKVPDQGTQILWEPGATYRLPELRVSNAGNLNLKYKVQITGIEKGRTPTAVPNLNDVIDWDITYGGTPLTTGSDEYMLNANETKYDVIKISGTMKTSANNDYQGLSIDGVAVTVYATQMTGEYDSSRMDYDADAQYPVYAVAAVEVDAATGLVTKDATLTTGETNADGDPVAQATVPAGAKVEDGTTQLELVIEDAETPANFTVKATEDIKTLEVKVTGLSASNEEPIKVEMYVGAGLSSFQLYHHDVPMNAKDSVEAVTADQDYYYDKATGLVTMLSKSFSPFTYTYQKGNWEDHAAEDYATAVDTATKTVTIASAEELALFAKQVTTDNINYSGYTVNITNDIDLSANCWKPINAFSNGGQRMSGITINGNDHTIRNMVVRYASTDDYFYGMGFIGNTAGSITIRDITFADADVTSPYGEMCYGNVGGIVVGYTYGTTLFENVSVIDSTIWGYGKIGCLLGMGADPGVKVTFKDCVSRNNTIHAAYDIGGLAGNIQRGNGVDNASVENCVVENINVVYDDSEKYVDLNNVSVTFKSNDQPSGTDVTKEISGKYLIDSGYYWCAYGDYYVSYGHSSYDAPVEGYAKCLANSEYPVNK